MSPAETPVLEWTAPPSCPSSEEAEAQLAELIESIGGARSRLAASVTISEGGDGQWLATVRTTVDGVLGERSLSGTDCREVTRAVALVLALSVRPEGSVHSEPMDTAPRDEPAAVSAMPPELPASDVATNQQPTPALRALLRSGAVFGVGALPGSSVGGETPRVIGRLIVAEDAV